MKYAFIVVGIVAVAAIIWYLARRPRPSAVALSSTYDGPIDQYRGGKTLLVAVHAPWASGELTQTSDGSNMIHVVLPRITRRELPRRFALG